MQQVDDLLVGAVLRRDRRSGSRRTRGARCAVDVGQIASGPRRRPASPSRPPAPLRPRRGRASALYPSGPSLPRRRDNRVREPRTRARARERTLTTHRATLIPGDGVGPELSQSTRRCVEATGVEFEWDVQEAGADVMDKYGTPLPEHVLESIRRTKVAHQGPDHDPGRHGLPQRQRRAAEGARPVRCLRPCRSYPGVRSRYEGVDIVISARTPRTCTRASSSSRAGPDGRADRRSVRPVGQRDPRGLGPLDQADHRSRARSASCATPSSTRAATAGKKVTAVHKANIMKFSDGLFLATAREVAKDYPDIAFEDRIVDNLCMQLVQRPGELRRPGAAQPVRRHRLATCAPAWSAGSGWPPAPTSASDAAVFEATHGSAPKYKGQNKVNPMAMMLSGVLMLHHLGETRPATASSGRRGGDRRGTALTADLGPADARPGPRRPT